MEETLVLPRWSSAEPCTPSTFVAEGADTSAEPGRVLTRPPLHGERNSKPWEV